MKKNNKTCLFILLILSLTFFSGGLQAQTGSGGNDDNDETEQPKTKYKVKKNVFRYNNVLSFYPLQSLINYMTLGYELKTGAKTAFKTIVGFAQKEGNFYDINEEGASLTKYTAFKVEMQYKYFINKKADVFNGVYFAPFGAFKACDFSYDTEERVYIPALQYYDWIVTHHTGKANAIQVGFLLGYHTKIGESFTADVFAGESFLNSSGNYKLASRVFDTYNNAVRLKIGACIGFGF